MYLCKSILHLKNMNEHSRNIVFPIGNFSSQNLGVFPYAEKYSTNNLFFSYFCVTHTQPHARNIPFLFYSEAYTSKIFSCFSCIAMEKMKIFAESTNARIRYSTNNNHCSPNCRDKFINNNYCSPNCGNIFINNNHRSPNCGDRFINNISINNLNKTVYEIKY